MISRALSGFKSGQDSKLLFCFKGACYAGAFVGLALWVQAGFDNNRGLKYINDWQIHLQKFFDTLNADQLMAFGKIAGLITILIALSSLVSVFLGENLIKYFNLEVTLD